MTDSIIDLPQYTAGHRPNWSLIPNYMIPGLRRYIENGVAPGSFLEAVLCNDLRGAVEYADDTNQRILHNYVQFLYNYAPAGSWGSERAFENWIKHGGLVGLEQMHGPQTWAEEPL